MEAIKPPTANGSRIEQMRQCPRFEKCSAPICPLDPDWQKCTLMNTDPVCYYQTEHAKTDAKAVFEGRGLSWLFELVSKPTPSICYKWGRIRRAVERAKQSGSKMGRESPWLKRGKR